jgi:hypothetical protein
MAFRYYSGIAKVKLLKGFTLTLRVPMAFRYYLGIADVNLKGFTLTLFYSKSHLLSIENSLTSTSVFRPPCYGYGYGYGYGWASFLNQESVPQSVPANNNTL